MSSSLEKNSSLEFLYSDNTLIFSHYQCSLLCKIASQFFRLFDLIFCCFQNNIYMVAYHRALFSKCILYKSQWSFEKGSISCGHIWFLLLLHLRTNLTTHIIKGLLSPKPFLSGIWIIYWIQVTDSADQNESRTF